MYKRDARTRLTGTITCVKSKITRVVDYSDYCYYVVLQNNTGYLLRKELFTQDEINNAKERECYFQCVNSGGKNSIWDIM